MGTKPLQVGDIVHYHCPQPPRDLAAIIDQIIPARFPDGKPDPSKPPHLDLIVFVGGLHGQSYFKGSVQCESLLKEDKPKDGTWAYRTKGVDENDEVFDALLAEFKALKAEIEKLKEESKPEAKGKAKS